MTAEVSHTFVVPAHGEPPWLERCLESLLKQTVHSNILIATSTYSSYLDKIASAHAIRLILNPGRPGIASDWNFALAQSHSTWTTLAHQDDWYEPTYVQKCLEAAEKLDDVQIVFTAANERVEASGAHGNTWAKRVLCKMAFGSSAYIRSSARKRLLLSFGNPIPCPSVMFHRRTLAGFTFEEGWRSNLDWSAWLGLAKRRGTFVYVATPLVNRTLHVDAATTRWLSDRAKEDTRLLRAIWPWPIGHLLSVAYGASRLPYRFVRTSDDNSGAKTPSQR